MSVVPSSPDGTVQIHASRADDGHWSASFDEHPEFAFGGASALLAAKRLVRSAESDDCPGPPIYARIGMILNLDSGRSPREVAKLFYAEPAEVEEAVRIYREGGVEGLLGGE